MFIVSRSTCTNQFTCPQSAHEYFTRTALSEAQRDGGATLSQQLSSLNQLHAWLYEKLLTFKRRFKRANGSLLGSVDPTSFSIFAEDVLYQGPLHLELPLDSKQNSDGSLSFAIQARTALRQQ